MDSADMVLTWSLLYLDFAESRGSPNLPWLPADPVNCFACGVAAGVASCLVLGYARRITVSIWWRFWRHFIGKLPEEEPPFEFEDVPDIVDEDEEEEVQKLPMATERVVEPPQPWRLPRLPPFVYMFKGVLTEALTSSGQSELKFHSCNTCRQVKSRGRLLPWQQVSVRFRLCTHCTKLG